jgi:branched-chain amino acid transport system substrate-binding protein
MINDTTGLLSSSFADGVGTAQARVALQNAQGGIDGRQIKLVVEDSQSSPSAVLAAAQSLVETKGVFGIVSDSAIFFGAAPYLTTAGVPVTGDGLDGPEWGTSPNMFTYGSPTFTTYPGGTSYNYTLVPQLMKSIGAKKVAVMSFASPSAIQSAKQVTAMLPQFGLQNCYLNLSVPLGGVDFTADVLQLKQSGCDSLVAAATESSEVALAAAIKNAGLNIKQYYYASYAQATLDSPAALAALDGSYGQTTVVAGHASTQAATQTLYNQLKKYDPSYKGLLDFGASIGWEGTDAMIEGLKLAGPNPTRASFISKLRTVTNYTIGGLSSTPVDFNYLTGNLSKTQCANFVQLKGSAFVPIPADGSPTCGTRVAYKG